jgi:hypothetical protein
MNPAVVISLLIMVLIALTIGFIIMLILKTHKKINSPWWVVFIPIYADVLIAVFLYFYTQGA